MKISYLVILLIFVSCNSSIPKEQGKAEEGLVETNDIGKLQYVKYNNGNAVDTVYVNQMKKFTLETLVETVNSITLYESNSFTSEDVIDTTYLDNDIIKYTFENSLISYFIFYNDKYGIIYGQRFFGVNEAFERLVSSDINEKSDSLSVIIKISKEECIVKPIEVN